MSTAPSASGGAAPPTRRALVVTVVHRPEDARIAHRELGALLDAGWDVTYAAPWSDTDTPRRTDVTTVDLPRAVGRSRLGPVLAARRLLAREGGRHDVVLLHDPELLLALPGLGLRNVVWDVHEDVASSLTDRSWVPSWALPLLRAGVRVVERLAERACARLLLAEHSYRDRFRGDHAVVLNVPRVPTEVPPPGTDRVVYVGRLSTSRGARELVEVGRRLRGEVAVELLGYADNDVEALLRQAHADGDVVWHGFVPNDVALERIRGAAFGLSLLRDEPNFRGSMPTKVVEYLANGLPVVTTPLREAVALLERHGLGTVVPFGDVDAVVATIRAGVGDPDALRAAGAAAHAAALADANWDVEGPRFVAELERVAGA